MSSFVEIATYHIGTCHPITRVKPPALKEAEIEEREAKEAWLDAREDLADAVQEDDGDALHACAQAAHEAHLRHKRCKEWLDELNEACCCRHKHPAFGNKRCKRA